MNRIFLSTPVLWALAASASASTMAINFGKVTPASPTETGYDNALYNDTASLLPTTVNYGTFGGVTLSVSTSPSTTPVPVDNRLRSIDRGVSPAYSGALDTLTQSWIGTQAQGSYLTVILGGVDAGLHTWTSYHFDNGSGASGNGNQNGKMEIAMSVDSGATFSIVNPSYQIQDNEGTVTSVIAPFSVDFTAVAGQSVQFRFLNNALGTLANNTTDPVQDFTLINGFNVAPVPEPSAALFSILGLAGFALRRRR